MFAQLIEELRVFPQSSLKPEELTIKTNVGLRHICMNFTFQTQKVQPSITERPIRPAGDTEVCIHFPKPEDRLCHVSLSSHRKLLSTARDRDNSICQSFSHRHTNKHHKSPLSSLKSIITDRWQSVNMQEVRTKTPKTDTSCIPTV